MKHSAVQEKQLSAEVDVNHVIITNTQDSSLIHSPHIHRRLQRTVNMGQTRMQTFFDKFALLLTFHVIQNLSLWRTWRGDPTVCCFICNIPPFRICQCWMPFLQYSYSTRVGTTEETVYEAWQVRWDRFFSLFTRRTKVWSLQFTATVRDPSIAMSFCKYHRLQRILWLLGWLPYLTRSTQQTYSTHHPWL